MSKSEINRSEPVRGAFRKISLPPYQNLTAPKGAKVHVVDFVADFQDRSKKTYNIKFTAEIVYGSKNSLKQKINTMEDLFIRFARERSLEELVRTPGIKIVMKQEEVSNG